MSRGAASYTDSEWAAVIAAGPLDHLPTHQIALLHRHWMWANLARMRMNELQLTEGPPEAEAWESEHNFMMFLWHALLYTVIEGSQKRGVRIGGAFRDDVRVGREPLRQARHGHLPCR